MSQADLKIHVSQLKGGAKSWSVALVIEGGSQLAGAEIELYYQGEQKLQAPLDDGGYLALELSALSPPSDLSAQVFFEVCLSRRRGERSRSKSFHPPLVTSALRSHLESARSWPSELPLRGADLQEIKLDRADLKGVDFTGADLSRASLIGAQLEGAKLKDCLLLNTDLTGADLSDADLQDAHIHGANLSGAIFIGSDWRGLRGVKLIDLKRVADQIVMDERQMKAMSLSVEMELREERERAEKERQEQAGVPVESTSNHYSSTYSRASLLARAQVSESVVEERELPPERLGAAVREQVELKERKRAESLAKHTQRRELRDGVSFEMKLIPEGSFIMGSLQGQEQAAPRHEVELTRPFFLMSTPVTQALYQAVMGPTRFKFPQGGHPAESVSWSDAVEFCNRLSAFEKLEPVYKVSKRGAVLWNQGASGYRLPTEAEWEYAARANNTYFYSGGDELDGLGWFKDNSSGSVQVVALKRPNIWGLYDMSGNVWEWCYDLYQENAYRQRLKTGSFQDPHVDVKHGIDGPRVIRGGSWSFEEEGARVSYRSRLASHFKTSRIGFRIARSPRVKKRR